MANHDVDFWKVRLAISGGLIHIASRIQPKVILDSGRLVRVEMDPIDELGDIIGYIDWSAVRAVTWRAAKSSDD